MPAALRPSRLPIPAVLIAMAALSATPAGAQAWLPEKGQIYTWLSYSNTDVGDHLFSRDLTPYFDAGLFPESMQGDSDHGADLGDIRANVVFLGGEWGVTDRIALSGDIAYVSSRYRGNAPESPLDDGSYQSEIQDLRLTARFAVPLGPIAFTPFVGVTAPLSDYEIVGHASAGRGLNEGHLGFNVGSAVGRHVYLQGNYTYSIVENAEEFSLDRHNGALEAGVFVGRSVILRAFGAWQRTVDGIDWFDDLGPGATQAHVHAHDQAARAHWSRVGGGVSWQALPDLSFFASYTTVVWGENTHESDGILLGTNWLLPAM